MREGGRSEFMNPGIREVDELTRVKELTRGGWKLSVIDGVAAQETVREGEATERSKGFRFS